MQYPVIDFYQERLQLIFCYGYKIKKQNKIPGRVKVIKKECVAYCLLIGIISV